MTQDNTPSHEGGQQDSDFVLQSFRQTFRGSAVVIAAVALVYAGLLHAVGDPHWPWHLALAALAVALQPMFRVQVPFRHFLGALLLLILPATASVALLALQYGPTALFHVLLLAYSPVLVTSGRLHARGKALLVLFALSLTLALDVAGSHALGWPRPPGAGADALEWMRRVNLVVLGLGTPALLYRYFRLVSWQHAELGDLAVRDPVTRLFNRRRALAVGESLQARLRRGLVRPFCVVMIDIDHFKLVNDAHGHEVGDAALVHVAHRVADCARATDIVARWGGEEFLVLLPDADLAAARIFAERVRDALAREPLLCEGRDLALTATLGLAQADPDDTLAGLIARADRALYAGKHGGRNRVMVDHDAG